MHKIEAKREDLASMSTRKHRSTMSSKEGSIMQNKEEGAESKNNSQKFVSKTILKSPANLSKASNTHRSSVEFAEN